MDEEPDCPWQMSAGQQANLGHLAREYGEARKNLKEFVESLQNAAFEAGKENEREIWKSWVDGYQTMEREIDQLRVQLAGCGVAACGGTESGQIVSPGGYGWSLAYQQVLELRRCYDSILNCFRAQDRSHLREKALQLKQTDGEGWAIGSLVDIILDLTAEKGFDFPVEISEAVPQGTVVVKTPHSQAIAYNIGVKENGDPPENSG